jgi:hypothetical protein
MNMPESLAGLLREKLSKDLAYWARGYEAAVERIEDHTDDAENPYWHSPADAVDAVPGERVVLDEYGGEESIESVRHRAFELLVMADLAETSTVGEPEEETA